MRAPAGGSASEPDDASTSVLVVEDDASIAAQLVRGLSRGGYQVNHVMTGNEALSWGQSDVVLLDLELPDLDGVQVCRKLRERTDAAIIVVTAPGGDVVRHGPLTVDIRTHRVTVSGSEVLLTPKEFDILECLASDPGRVVTRQEILETAWDAHWYGPTKVLDVHMASLRRKLGIPGLIETVYGRGFRLGEA
jgi:DNA-binding response OmpR family regulator